MLYPLKFQPIAVERVWGGNALARFGKPVPPNKLIGESWEICDREDVQSVVANGPHKGDTLGELIAKLGVKLVGNNIFAEVHGTPQETHAIRFPLLIKLLDARERLSLQVHPPPNIAAIMKVESKAELWYVLQAEPHAHLIAGLRRGVSGADFLRTLEAAADPDKASPNDLIEKLVHRFPIAQGDAFFVPSGRMHAIDAGSVLVEIQQNSDTTFRVYDWGRVGLDGKPRELHVQQSIASVTFLDIEPGKIKPQAEYRGGNGLWRLIECDHFNVHKLELRNAWLDRCDGSTFHIIGSVQGTVGILTPGNIQERLAEGEFALIPAGLGHYTLTPQSEVTHALKVFVPNTRT